MDACEFFLEQYHTVRSIVNNLFLKGMSDDQMRHQPKEGLNSMAWYLWHTARWQDSADTLIIADHKQVLDQRWMKRMNIPRPDIGTGMAREGCTALNETVELAGLRDYRDEVGNNVCDVARSVPSDELRKAVDTVQLQRMLDDGTIANERSRWLPSFLEGKNKGWFLSMAVWHTAEHLLGGVVCVRRVSGVPVAV